MKHLWQIIKGKGHPVNEISNPHSPQAAVQQHSAVVQKTYIELKVSLLTDHYDLGEGLLLYSL